MSECPRCGNDTLRRVPVGVGFCVALECECGAFGWVRMVEPYTSCIYAKDDKPALFMGPNGWTEEVPR
jgi:hypothetical protein